MNSPASTKRKGFPNYFKKIGWSVVVLALAVTFLVKPFIPALTNSYYLSLATKDLVILGLLMVAIANDKVNDEMYLLLRLQTMAFAFISAVFYVILYPLSDIFFDQKLNDINGQQLIMVMLLAYIILYAIQKKKLN